MNFFTLSNLPPSVDEKVFDEKKYTYCFELDISTGRKILVRDKEVDIQEEIQAFEKDCNIYNILNRYLYGDVNALNQVSTSYADLSTVPNSLMEAMNLSLKLKNDFNMLKPEVKAEFNNDFNEYLNSVSNGKIFQVFEKYGISANSNHSQVPAAENKVPAAENKESEVTSNE